MSTVLTAPPALHAGPAAVGIVYFSGVSANTHRFAMKLDADAERIPIRSLDPPMPSPGKPYVLITPTYGGGSDGRAVPRQVIRFLNDPVHRALLVGVVAGGNTSFGSHFALAGRIISSKCGVPLLHTFEVLGTPADVDIVRQGLERTWLPQPK